MTGLGATPWVDRNLNAAWSRIAEVSPFGEASMPIVESRKGSRVKVQEYGCGHYGCVMPTSMDELVFKLSSDPTEAYFVVAASQLGHWPEGIVRYQAIFQLGGVTHKGRPLYAIWREAAHDLGFPLRGVFARTADYETRRDRDLLRLLDAFRTHAHKARMKIKKASRVDDPFAIASRAAGPAMQDDVWNAVWLESEFAEDPIRMDQPRDALRGIAQEIRACAVIAELMENTDGSDLIGGALGYYLDQGMLLADVHGNNVGKVSRGGDEYRVITDPGHAVPVAEHWRGLLIPEV